MKNEGKILGLVLTRRTDFIKLILGAFILALGSSLLANYLTELTKSKSDYILFISIFLIFIVVVYFVFSIMIDTKKTITIEAAIVFDNKKKRIIGIPRYEFSESLSNTLQAVFLENEALKTYWENDFKEPKERKSTETKDKKEPKISNNVEKGKPNREVNYFTIIRISESEFYKKEKRKSDKILKEAIEHSIIDNLSTHLSTYFNNYSNEDKFIKEHTRKDFPDILLENRIINLLSTPFEDRPIFVKSGIVNDPPEGEIVSIFGSDGSKFERFDLVLPKGSKVTRPKEGKLEIDNKRINLKIELNYDGFGFNLPHGFEQNYLGVSGEELETKMLQIILSYKIKPFSLLLSSKWNYHNWIDSFTDGLIEFASFDSFVEKIKWETNLTNIISLNHRRRIIDNLKQKEEKKNKSSFKTNSDVIEDDSKNSIKDKT